MATAVTSSGRHSHIRWIHLPHVAWTTVTLCCMDGVTTRIKPTRRLQAVLHTAVCVITGVHWDQWSFRNETSDQSRSSSDGELKSDMGEKNTTCRVKIRLYTARLIGTAVCCRDLDTPGHWRKGARSFPHKMPTPNFKYLLVWLYNQLPSFHSHRLSGAVIGPVARLKNGVPTHDALRCQVGLPSGSSLGSE